jgi:hypothetical protein
VEEERRRNNIIIFGLQERGYESYEESMELVVKFLNEKMGVETHKENIDYVTRLGRRRGERPILVKFTTFFKKLEVWRNKRNLAGTKIRVDEDLSMESRKIRRELIPYLKDAKKWGHRAFLRKHTLIINGQAYDLNYLKENVKSEDVISQRDTPRQPAESTQDMTLQQTGSVEARREGNIQRGEGDAPAVSTRGSNTKQLMSSQQAGSVEARREGITRHGEEGAPAIWVRGNNTNQLTGSVEERREVITRRGGGRVRLLCGREAITPIS